MPYYLILRFSHYLKKLKSKKVIPFLRPFAKNDAFLLYIVFFRKLQKVSKKVYKKCKNNFIFCIILLTKYIKLSILYIWLDVVQ